MITIRTVTNYERLSTNEKKSYTRLVNILTDKGNRVIRKEGNILILSDKINLSQDN